MILSSMTRAALAHLVPGAYRFEPKAPPNSYAICSQEAEMDRRHFVAYMAGTAATSAASLSKLNATIYRSIADLNRDYPQDSPDGAYWEALRKYFIMDENLVMMTSAYAPKYFPESLIHYMNTRGRQKILFASDHPVLSMERCISEARSLPLRPGVLENFLHRNAARFFWGEAFDE